MHTVCLFMRFCTATKVLPRSVDVATGFFSSIHDISSSMSLLYWYINMASSKLSLLILLGSVREEYL